MIEVSISPNAATFVGGANLFLIKGYELSLSYRQNQLNEVSLLVNGIYESITSFNVNKFTELIRQHKESVVFKVSSFVFPEEFKEFINNVCDLLYRENKKINNGNVFKVILGLLEDEETYSRANKTYYVLVRETVQEYLDKLCGELIAHIKNKEKENVWRVCSIIFDRLSSISLLDYCIKEASDDFEKYVYHCVMDFANEGKQLSWLKICNYVFYGTKNKYKYTSSYIKYLEKDNIFKKVINEIYNKQFDESKKWKYRFEDDIWEVYSQKLQIISKLRFDFTTLSGELRVQVKQYIRELLNTTEAHRQIARRLRCIKVGIQCLYNADYKIHSLTDINIAHAHHLFDDLQNLPLNNGSPYSLMTVKEIFTELKLIYNWLMEKNEVEYFSNPFEQIQFVNIDDFVNKTKYIPEVVIEQMQDKLDELPEHIKSAWIIMIHSGMRISEVLGLEADCLYFDKEANHMMLKYVRFKIKKHTDAQYHTIPAKPILVEYIENQIEQSKLLRQQASTNLIFLTKQYERITTYSEKWMAYNINKLIEKYAIKDEFGKLHHYTHHQCRKTVTVELISNGASIKEVAKFVGHLSIRTTERHYNDLQDSKQAELNNDFWNVVFKEIEDSEVMVAFSKEEKEALIAEVKVGSRETPEGHGTCLKHITFGPCIKKKCAGCHFLITGPQQLPKWYQLYKETKQEEEELLKYYQDNEINDYQEYRVYKSVKHDLAIYRDKIEKTEQIAKKAGMNIERPTDFTL